MAQEKGGSTAYTNRRIKEISRSDNVKSRSGVSSAKRIAVKKQYADAALKKRSLGTKSKAAEVIEKVRRGPIDYPMLIITMVLLVFGIGMMFSASYAVAYRDKGDSMYYLKRQCFTALIGLVIMIGAIIVPYRVFLNKRIMQLVFVGSVVMMLAVTLTGSGVTQGGEERWLSIGGFIFQPSEVLKYAMIVLFAYLAHVRADKMRDLYSGFAPYAVGMMVCCTLTMSQSHLSATIILAMIGVIMMFCAGVRMKHLIVFLVVLVVGLCLGLVVLKALGHDYFSDRIQCWLYPESDIADVTYQTYQSLVTIGSGGFFGLGLGNSRQKYSYLPFTQNDFLFSIICEELGFVGAILVILLFVIFILRGFYIATHARDKFGMILAAGITSQIGIQALLNIAVVSNAIPNTGISLPFFSYGGTALVMQLAEVGVLLSVSREAATE